MRREVVKRFLETGPPKQTKNVEKTSFLRCLYREGDKGTRGTRLPKPLELGSSIFTLDSRGTSGGLIGGGLAAATSKKDAYA